MATRRRGVIDLKSLQRFSVPGAQAGGFASKRPLKRPTPPPAPPRPVVPAVKVQTQRFGGSVAETAVADPDIVTEGFQLTGTPQQVSVFGEAIPRTYGSIVVDGNIIWSTPITETMRESVSTSFESETNRIFEEQQTELGDTENVFFDVTTTTQHTTITRTFAVHAGFAVACCKGPIDGVGRIWANGNLIFNFRADNFSATVSGGTIRVHLGTETQQPDPLIQASQGIANTPAFRGLAYVVFDNLDLEPYGGQIPDITIEVVTNPSSETPYDTIVSPVGRADGKTIVHAPTGLSLLVVAGAGALIDHRSLTVIAAGTITGVFGSGIGVFSRPTLDDVGQFFYIGGAAQNNDPIYKIDAFSMAVVDSFGIYSGLDGATSTIASNRMIAYRRENQARTFVESGVEVTSPREMLAAHAQGFKQVAWIDPSDMTMLGKVGAGQPHPFGTLSVELGWSAIGPGFKTYTVAADATTLKIFIHRVLDPRPAIGDTPDNIVLEDTVDLSASFTSASAESRIQWISQRQSFAVAKGDEVLLWHPVDGVIGATLTPFAGDAFSDGWWHSGPAVDGLWAMRGSGDVARVLNVLSWSLAASPDAMDDWVADDYRGGGGYDPSLRALIAHGTTDIRVLYLDRIGASTGVSLASVVAAECAEAGLAAGDIDVTALTGDTVRGFIIDHLAPAREGLEVLSQLYFFDAVESGNKIMFPKRDAISDAAVPEDDLGVEAEQALDEGRLMEQELPLVVSITYLSKEREYQEAVQTEQRVSEAVATQEIVNIKVNIVFSEDDARQAVQKFMALAWTAQRTFNTSLGRKHALLDPGDVITITRGGVSHLVRILAAQADGGVIELEGEAADPAALIATVGGTNVGARLGVIVELVRTQGFVLDIPMIRDGDDTVGPYIAASPERAVTGWRGSNVYVGEGGPAFDLLDTVGDAAIWGRTMGVLADQARWTVFDRTNTFTVAWVHGIADLASVTEADVLNGKNGFLVGNEILQAATVTDNGDGTVTLSVLLRGRNGTEWAIAGHVAGEAVIFITNLSPHKLVQDAALIGVERFFRFDTLGTSKVNSQIIPFTDTGRAKKPYAPSYLKSSWSAGGDGTFTWLRRCRLPAASVWPSDGSLPLGEDSEAYEVDIKDSAGTVARTFTGLSTETVTYTKAQQNTDGIIPGFTLLWNHVLTNPDAESGDTTGWVADLSLPIMQAVQTPSGYPSPFEGSWQFTGQAAPSDDNAMSQEVDLAAAGVDTGRIDAGDLRFRVRSQRGIANTPDKVEFQIRFKDAAKAEISIVAEGLIVPTPVDTWALATFVADMPANTRFVDVILHAQRGLTWNTGIFDVVEAATGERGPGVDVTIYQMSELVGRGFGRQATL